MVVAEAVIESNGKEKALVQTLAMLAELADFATMIGDAEVMTKTFTLLSEITDTVNSILNVEYQRS